MQNKSENENNAQRVYILGAGAIGKSLAVFFKYANRDVRLLRTSTDDYPLREDDVSVTLHDGTQLHAAIPTCALADKNQLDGIIVLANKAHANQALAEKLISTIADAPIIIMQNGLEVEKPFTKNFPSVYRCVLFATSQVEASGNIRFKPVQPSPIGIIKGDAKLHTAIISTLDTAFFRFEATDNIQPLIWKKAIANCVFNSICPLLETDNGLFHRNEEAQALASRVIRECVLLAKEAGIDLEPDEILKTVLMISRASDGQLISTLQDIRNGRDTEIESLNFAMTSIAARLNKAMLVRETGLLGELTRLKALLHKRVPA